VLANRQLLVSIRPHQINLSDSSHLFIALVMPFFVNSSLDSSHDSNNSNISLVCYNDNNTADIVCCIACI